MIRFVHPNRASARAGLTTVFLIARVFAAANAVRADEIATQPPVPPCDQSAPAVYGQISPTVVSIAAMSTNSYDVENRFDRVVGSGVIVDPSGLVLTNSHVVFGRQAINVTLDDGTTLPGLLVGADPLFDVALVRVAPPGSVPLPAARLGDSDHVIAGEDVFAIGNPFGLEQTLSRGIVSAVNRLLPGVPLSLTEPMIQTDAPINPGNSGGPLINRCAEVIGITTSILSEAQNIGFAIPINLIKSVMPSLIDSGRIVRPWLGVQGELVSQPLKEILRVPLVDGFLVEGVEPGSPAERIGIVGGTREVVIDGQPVLLGGDIVTRIDGAPVDDFEQLSKALRSFAVGQSIHMTIFRNKQVVETDCVLTERPLLAMDIPERRSVAPMGERRPRSGRADALRGVPSSF
jgi:S1-C subfamily serine protease